MHAFSCPPVKSRGVTPCLQIWRSQPFLIIRCSRTATWNVHWRNQPVFSMCLAMSLSLRIVPSRFSLKFSNFVLFPLSPWDSNGELCQSPKISHFCSAAIESSHDTLQSLCWAQLVRDHLARTPACLCVPIWLGDASFTPIMGYSWLGLKKVCALWKQGGMNHVFSRTSCLQLFSIGNGQNNKRLTRHTKLKDCSQIHANDWLFASNTLELQFPILGGGVQHKREALWLQNRVTTCLPQHFGASPLNALHQFYSLFQFMSKNINNSGIITKNNGIGSCTSTFATISCRWCSQEMPKHSCWHVFQFLMNSGGTNKIFEPK